MNTNIRQHDKSDCAVACMASVARYYGRDIPLTILREASGTDVAGTSIKGIIDACSQVGFNAKGYRSPERDISPLLKLDVPAILHVINEEDELHFVVLYGFRRGKALIMDPSTGTRIKKDIETLHKGWSGYLVVMTPGLEEINNLHISSLYRYTSLFLLSKGDILLSLLGAAAYIVAGISTALFLQHIIDKVLPAGDMAGLVQTGAMLLVIMLSSLFIGYGRIILLLRTGIRTDSHLILTYLRRLFALPTGFFAHRGAGELNSRISDAVKVRNLLTEGLGGLFTGVLMLAVSFALMFTYHWKLALLTFTFIPLYLLLYLITDRVNRRYNREIISSAASFEETSVESIAAARAVKYFGSEEYICDKLEKKYVKLSDRIYRGGRYTGLFATSTDAISKLLTVTLLTVGSVFIFRGELSVGELVSFYTMAAYFSSPLSRIVSLNHTLTEANISMERIFDIIDLEPEGRGTMRFPLEGAKEIVADNISFAYPGCDSVIEDFSLTITKGTITAIRGESGCGKSSLAALLMRDYKPTKGKILIDGTDINLIDMEQWRSYVSIVPQESILLNCNIIENITGCEADPDLDKVMSLLEELGLKKFISSLPTGVLTGIGERGCRLSGGQRQRIALARALYRDPQVLILDEATSSLDAESQSFILNKIKTLRDEGRSVVMITHRTDNTTIADKIITMSARS